MRKDTSIIDTDIEKLIKGNVRKDRDADFREAIRAIYNAWKDLKDMRDEHLGKIHTAVNTTIRDIPDEEIRALVSDFAQSVAFTNLDDIYDLECQAGYILDKIEEKGYDTSFLYRGMQ